MPITYDKIASTTLVSATASIDFTSISSTYTDLVVVASLGGTTSTVGFYSYFNNDNSALYSNLSFYGGQTGTFPGTAIQGSGAYSGLTQFYGGVNSYLPTTVSASYTMNIQSYSNASIFKQMISKYSYKAEVNILAGVYRSTSAINRVTLITSSSTFLAGSKVAIYGIKAA
jgi:hypothetical protein